MIIFKFSSSSLLSPSANTEGLKPTSLGSLYMAQLPTIYYPETSIYLSVYPFICVSVYLRIRLSVYPFICVSVYLCIRLSVYPFICVSVYIRLSIYLSIYLYTYLSIYLYQLNELRLRGGSINQI